MTGMAIERDFCKLTLARQAELRRIAVAMVRAGKTRIEAAEAGCPKTRVETPLNQRVTI